MNFIRIARSLTLLWLLVLASWLASWLAAGPAVAAPQRLWDRPAFSATAEELRAALQGAKITPGAHVVILFEDERIVFDAEGRRDDQRHQVYQVLTVEGARQWAEVEIGWAPWHHSLGSSRSAAVGEPSPRSITPRSTFAPRT